LTQHSFPEEVLPEVESEARFHKLRAVVSGGLSDGGEMEEMFTTYHDFEGLN